MSVNLIPNSSHGGTEFTEHTEEETLTEAGGTEVHGGKDSHGGTEFTELTEEETLTEAQRHGGKR